MIHLSLAEKLALIVLAVWFIRNRAVDLIGSLVCGSWYGWKAQAYCKWWGWILPHR